MMCCELVAGSVLIATVVAVVCTGLLTGDVGGCGCGGSNGFGAVVFGGISGIAEIGGVRLFGAISGICTVGLFGS